MSDNEIVRVYADLLGWGLMLLAAGGIPIVIGGLFAMVMRMRLMIGSLYRPPQPPPPPPFPPHERRG